MREEEKKRERGISELGRRREKVRGRDEWREEERRGLRKKQVNKED